MSVECTLLSHGRAVAGTGVGAHGTRASLDAPRTHSIGGGASAPDRAALFNGPLSGTSISTTATSRQERRVIRLTISVQCSPPPNWRAPTERPCSRRSRLPTRCSVASATLHPLGNAVSITQHTSRTPSRQESRARYRSMPVARPMRSASGGTAAKSMRRPRSRRPSDFNKHMDLSRRTSRGSKRRHSTLPTGSSVEERRATRRWSSQRGRRVQLAVLDRRCAHRSHGDAGAVRAAPSAAHGRADVALPGDGEGTPRVFAALSD
jgi:hypothetical protein